MAQVFGGVAMISAKSSLAIGGVRDSHQRHYNSMLRNMLRYSVLPVLCWIKYLVFIGVLFSICFIVSELQVITNHGIVKKLVVYTMAHFYTSGRLKEKLRPTIMKSNPTSCTI